MICGAPAPLFSAAVAIAKPTTGPPGVSAPATVANSRPAMPLSGPSSDGISCFGRISAMKPEPIMPIAMRGSSAKNSRRAKRSESANIGWSRRNRVEAERHHDRPQRDVDGEVHGAAGFMKRHAYRAARPARIGSGSEKMIRQVTKSRPKNGSSQTMARVYPISVQRDHEGAGRARVGAGDEKRGRDRVDGERPAGKDRARDRRDEDTAEPRLRPHPSGDRLARQQQRDERADQAAGQHLRQHGAEQAEIFGENFEKARLSVAKEHEGRRADRERRDDGRGPIEGTPLARRSAHAAARSADASRASLVMRAKSPAAIASFGATHEPPTASTFGQPR